MDDVELLEIKERAWESLSKIPGVHAVGIANKVVAGSRKKITMPIRRMSFIEEAGRKIHLLMGCGLKRQIPTMMED